jgi:hypothetical protein
MADTRNTKKRNYLIIAIALPLMGYMVITGIQDLNKSRNEKLYWTEQDCSDMVERCIIDSEQNGIDFPELTKEYCECSSKLVIAKVQKKEYLSLLRKSMDEKAEKLLPIFENRLKKYQDEISKRRE